MWTSANINSESGLDSFNRYDAIRSTPTHEPKGRAGCPHPAAAVRCVQHARRRGEDTQPYPPLAVQGFKARSFVSEDSHLSPTAMKLAIGPGQRQARRSAMFIVVGLQTRSSSVGAQCSENISPLRGLGVVDRR